MRDSGQTVHVSVICSKSGEGSQAFKPRAVRKVVGESSENQLRQEMNVFHAEMEGNGKCPKIRSLTNLEEPIIADSK